MNRRASQLFPAPPQRSTVRWGSWALHASILAVVVGLLETTVLAEEAKTDQHPRSEAPASAEHPSPLNPQASELPPGETKSPDVEQRLDDWISRVVRLSSRLAALREELFSTRLRVLLHAEQSQTSFARLQVTLDGATVYDAPAHASFEEAQAILDQAVAPGMHILGVEVEQQDRLGKPFGAWQAARFVVQVPDAGHLATRLDIESESSMGEDFLEDGEGGYELSVRLRTEVGE